DIPLTQDPDRLEDGHDAGLVVTSQHGAAVGADDVAVDHEADLLRRSHGVHVGREQEGRRAGLGPGEAREEIAGLAANLLPAVVHFARGAHALEDALEPPGDGPFAACQARDPRQLEELVPDAAWINDAGRIDHAGSVWRWRLNQSRLRLSASMRCSGSE